jgi:hypothetical protein
MVVLIVIIFITCFNFVHVAYHLIDLQMQRPHLQLRYKSYLVTFNIFFEGFFLCCLYLAVVSSDVNLTKEAWRDSVFHFLKPFQKDWYKFFKYWAELSCKVI